MDRTRYRHNRMKAVPVDESRLSLVTDTLRTQYWVWTYYSADDAPTSLLDALRTNLPHIDPQSWAERFYFGGIYVNGQPALHDQPLIFPCRIEYYEPKFEISQAQMIFPAFEERFVVYQDEDIIVAFKPPKLSSMPAKEQRHFSLKTSLEKFCNRPIHMPSRLDVSAQGLVIVSTSARAHAPLQQAFESRAVTKKYLCATTGVCEWDQKRVTAPIGRDPLHPVLRTTACERGKSAETIISNLGKARSDSFELTVLCAQPITGRTHQIRVHTASEQLPLFGDNFYGGGSAPYLHLVSSILECTHPVSKARLHFVLPTGLRPDWVNATIEKVSPLNT